MSAMGLRWYVPLPGPFHISGGWITGLFMAMLWMCWLMFAVIIQFFVLLAMGVVMGVDAGRKVWRRRQAGRAARTP